MNNIRSINKLSFEQKRTIFKGEEKLEAISDMFRFFQNFLKDTGILKELEQLGITDGDTVKMYGLQFDYYK